MSNFIILVDYRETKTEETDKQETIMLDEQRLVTRLQAFGHPALFAETDGSKLRYHFKPDVMPTFVRLQKAYQNSLKEPLLIDVAALDKAEQGWRENLAMMRNFKNRRID